MRRTSPDNTLGCLIQIMLLIPVGIYYLLKWVIVGIATLCHSIAASRNAKSINVDFSQIDSMDGHDFEYFVADVLRGNGYRDVVVTKGSGDFGVDITAKKDKQRYAFQCKCYQSNLGVKPIQEVYGGLKKYNAQIGVVVTNVYFTSHAKELADSLGVMLWDRDKLAALIHDNNFQTTKSVENTNGDVAADILSPPELSSNHSIILKGDADMATRIGAGKYVFGEDLPLGKYNLKVVSGTGRLKIQSEAPSKDGTANYDWMDFGEHEHCAKSYNGLSLPLGWWFSLEDDVIVEITKAKMLEIE